jgi:hypothetical protein
MQAGTASSASITRHGWDESRGRLRVARTDATALYCHGSTTRLERVASDVVVRHRGARQWAGNLLHDLGLERVQRWGIRASFVYDTV